MQAWSLREPIVKAVPKENLLILDLNGAKSQQENACWGYPLVAGNLHNFGGVSTCTEICVCLLPTNM